MVTQPDVLMHQCVDVGRDAFAFLSARVLENVLDNACCTLAMFPYFCKILAQVAKYVVDVVGIIFWYFVDVVLYVVVEVVKQRV